MNMIGYKVLAADGSPQHGGSGLWHLPVGKRPGKWMPKISNIAPCQRGYHFCRHEADLIHWLGPVIWRVEVRGDVIEKDDKAVAQQARLIGPTLWNDRIARLFAADCAEQVLHQIQGTHRATCAQAIAVVRNFASGEATKKELDAARAAACDAVRAAACDAAWAAVGAAARAAVRAAVRAAAWAAAGAAACDAAWAWQANRLRQYLSGEIA